MHTNNTATNFRRRIDLLRETKLDQTREKQRVLGPMDHDDWGLILPPAEQRTVRQRTTNAGKVVNDCLLAGFELRSNHPSGSVFGAQAVGREFRRLLEHHPVYLDPLSSMAGGYMVKFERYRNPRWNPEFDFSHLADRHEKYDLVPGIVSTQHFCQDISIGLELGWSGLLEKVLCHGAGAQDEKRGFYRGLEDVVRGVQHLISRHAEAARHRAREESDPELSSNLAEIARVNAKLVNDPPASFREAVQWILWSLLAARMYNGSGSLGKIDVLLEPYYVRDTSEGILTDEEAMFHLACMLLRDPAYMQVGGPDTSGRDATNRVSYLVLEAAHALRIPANVGVAVGDSTDPGLLKRGVEIIVEDKTGVPKFLGVDSTIEGFMRNGYSAELARSRAYSGCHWSGIPGREHTMNDCVKVNFARVFEVALDEMVSGPRAEWSVDTLWTLFVSHLAVAVNTLAESIDFHREYHHRNEPELVLDLLCHGPVEKGLDASCGGVEFANIGVDGAALATVADSFAALEQRIEREERISWEEIIRCLRSNWSGTEAEAFRQMMKNTPRYGRGGTLGDEYAERISEEFTRIVKRGPTPGGAVLVPGLFSWTNTVSMGKRVGATPDGRFAETPISHGANPQPGFARQGAPTLMAAAIARVQPGYGNAAPMQLELDFPAADRELAVIAVAGIIRTHFDLGGTQVNLNVVDRKKILEAHEDPSRFPDLVVRVTGFSAYFASLSPMFRQLIVERIVEEESPAV